MLAIARPKRADAARSTRTRAVRGPWLDAAAEPLPSGSAFLGPAAGGHGGRASQAVGGRDAVCSRRAGRPAQSGHRRTTTGRSVGSGPVAAAAAAQTHFAP